MELYGTKDVCSAANKDGKSRTIVNVDEMSTHAVPFVIVPIGEPGKYTIEVRAMVYGSFFGDGVKKDLLVVVSFLDLEWSLAALITMVIINLKGRAN